MKKLTKKQGIIIGIVVAMILVIAIVLGIVFAGSSKDIKDKNEPETETVTDKETDKATNEEENESKEEDKTGVTEEDTQSDAINDTQTNTEEPVVTKTTMYAKSNVNVRSGAGTSNSQIGSLIKGQEVAKIGEENGWSKIEFNGGIGYVSSKYLSTEKVSASTANSGAENGNGSGTGSATTTPSNPTPTPEPSPYAGMYSHGDSVSFERMNQCATILDTGIASPIVPVDRGQYHAAYWNGKLWIIAAPTNGAWMYVKLGGWYADTTNVGSDETRPGYAEIPSLIKQCLETIAPEGGTELYNKISALVSQYGASDQIPTQGKISESIPGLYVTLERGRGGLEIDFWAE